MATGTQTGAAQMATKFSIGQVIRYTNSGKLYKTTGSKSGSGDTNRVGVIGLRNGQEFGRIRFLDADRCEAVQPEKE
jgi:hypothetical protein